MEYSIPVTVLCVTGILALKMILDHKRGSGKRARAIPRGTERARRGRKPKGEPKPEKPAIPTPGEPLSMD